MKDSSKIDLDLAALRTFQREFAAYVAYEPNEVALSDARVGRILYQERVGETGRAAGAAASALAMYGSGTIDVAGTWVSVSQPFMDAYRRRITAELAHAIGAAEAAHAAALREERTFTYRLARVIGWPRRLAETVGGSRTRRAVVRTIGYAGQLSIVVFGGLLVWSATYLIQALLTGQD